MLLRPLHSDCYKYTQRTRQLKINAHSAVHVTLCANRSIRNYGQEDYESLAEQQAISVKQRLTFDVYRSPAFLRALLVAGIPLALYDHFADVSLYSLASLSLVMST